MSDKFEQKLFKMAAQEQMILPKELNETMDASLRQITEKHGKKKVLNFRRSLILAAALVMLFSITATAAVGALRQRMEAMNREKLEEYFTQIYTSRISADNYNRPLTDSEQERMAQLGISYEEQGLFPEGELTMIDEPEDYKGGNVAFLKNTSTFFFPEKEMSDEQLLQVIDFRAKRDYSLQKINQMMADGEMEFPEDAKPSVQEEATDSAILESKAVLNPQQELAIPYTGELSLRCMAAGNDCILLGGREAIHRMEIGSSDSTVLFNGFDKNTQVTALCQDAEGNIYAGLQTRTSNEGWDMGLWVIDENGNFLREIDLSPYVKKAAFTMGGEPGSGYITRMAADDNYLYLRGMGFTDAGFLLIIDKEGNLVSKMSSTEYYSKPINGLGIGKDGKAYTVIEDKNNRLGIASINPEKGSLETVYSEIVPEDTISIDLIAPGYDDDFLLWGYSGSFSFNLSETAATLVTPVYEMPCPTEGALYLALPDGRIVFAYCTEYSSYTTEEGIEYHERVPEKTCFYYLPTLRK